MPNVADPSLRLIRLFQSETAVFGEERGPIHARLTLVLLAAMLASLFCIAALLPVDRVVTSIFGQIVTTDPVLVIEPLDASIIKSLDVRDGERVHAGQLLATLDPTLTDADLIAAEAQLASLDAQIARCEAELEGKPYAFAPGSGADAVRYAAIQHSFFDQRQAQFQAQIRSYKAQIEQGRSTIVRLEADRGRYADRAQLARQVETMRQWLVGRQLDSQLNLLSAIDQKTEMIRNAEVDEHSLAETQHQVDSTTALLDNFIQQWRAQTSQELVTARNQRDVATSELNKARKHRELVRIEAPDDAIVLSLAHFSVGSVAQPGQQLMELARLNSPMEAEIYIAPRDIGFLRPGDRTSVKLDAYQYVEHGLIEGQLTWLSEGTFTASGGGTGGAVTVGGTSSLASAGAVGIDQSATQMTPPFYKARVSLKKLMLHNVPEGTRLVPGMTLAADVHVGQRSLFWYLTRGLLRNIDESMREP